MVFESDKVKNDEKPKGRPRRPMILVALAMMAIGAIGALWNSSAQTPPPPKTVITSYEVRIESQQMTITTQNQTTTTTTSTTSVTTGNQASTHELSNYVAALLKSLQAIEKNPTPK